MIQKRLVVAHRGIHATGATENTMRAFELSIELGADMIELDVRRTAAGELAILHDHKLRGVRLDAGSLDDFEDETGFRPPLLPDVLAWAAGKIALDVELKEDGYAEQLAPLLTEFMAEGGDLIVTSFLDPVLATLHEQQPELKLGLLLALTADRAVERAQDCGARIVLPEMKLACAELIDAIVGAELEPLVWDFMAAKDAALLDDPRIAGVITDDVTGALHALRCTQA
jgi:glycerophosphoryl diester phosphodiesterase